MRYGGGWTRRQRLKNGGIALLARAALGASDLLPRRVLHLATRGAGALAALWLSRRARRTTESALSPTLGAAAAHAAARACFGRAGENAATTLLLRRAATRALDLVPRDEGVEAFRAVLARGRGAVFVTGHLGPFELLPAAIAELGWRPAVVVRESYDPRLNRLVDAHRLTRGIEVIHRGDRSAATRIVRALRAGQPVGFLPDLAGRVPCLAVPFLGTVRPFPFGPQQLAQRLGVPLLVGGLSRDGLPDGKFRLVFEELPTAGSVAALTARVAERLEALIQRERADFPWMALGQGPESSRGGARRPLQPRRPNG